MEKGLGKLQKRKITTNLFCIIGKPGTGKQSILDCIFSNARFIDRYNILRFTCGTTKDIRVNDYDKSRYDRYSYDEYKNINPSLIIESRSYDNILDGRTEYYFTLESHIEFGKTMIGITTLFQYEELKKWAQIKQMENLLLEINIYPIYIESPLFCRIKRLIWRSKGDENFIYEVCVKIISERYEYRPVIENKVIDRSNPDVLIIDNGDSVDFNITIAKQIRIFIEKKIKV